MVKSILKKGHLVLGLMVGVIVVVVSLSGSLYVFANEIMSICYKDRLTIDSPVVSERVPVSAMIATAKNASGFEGMPLRIIVPSETKKNVIFVFQKVNKDALTYSKYMEYFKTVYVNPYSGNVVKVENTKWEFFNIILWVHFSLLLGYGVGAFIVRWSVVAFILLLISGIVLWWPKNAKVWRSRTWFRWKPGFGWRRKNFDLHAIVGFYGSFLALIMALTGLFWAFESFGDQVKNLANGFKETKEEKLISTGALTELNPLNIALNHLISNSPTAKYHVIKLPRNETGPLVGVAYSGESTNYDRTSYYFDQSNGGLLLTQSFNDLSNGDKVGVLNYDLHVGSIGGLPTKVLYFFVSLLVGSLPITGFLYWRGRAKKR